MPTSVGYRHGDYPVGAGATLGSLAFITRAQTFEVTRVYPATQVQELGNVTPVGVVTDVNQFRGRMVAYIIQNNIAASSIEAAFGGTSALQWSSGSTHIAGPIEGIQFARLTNVEYSARVGGFATATYTFEGTDMTGAQTVTATTPPTGTPAYRTPNIAVTVGGSGSILRAQAVTVRVNLRANRLEELNNANVVGYAFDSPEVRADIDWVESTALTGFNTGTVASPVDLIINIAGIRTLTVYDAVTTDKTYRGTVGGWATRRMSFFAMGNETEGKGGFSIS